MSTLFSVGQMNQLGDALEAAGFTPDDVTHLRSFTKGLGLVRDVLDGYAKIVKIPQVIDLDAEPYVPNTFGLAWEVREHIKGGQFEWDPAQVELYVSEQQHYGKIKGNLLRKELKHKVFNANLLDWLLENPRLIPDGWKGKNVLFWGTLYHYSHGGRLFVRSLLYYGVNHGWGSGFRGLSNSFDVHCPAVVPAGGS